MRFRPRYYKFWVSLLFVILKSTWVCRHWWVEQKNRVSSTLKKGCGKSFKGGKKNSCLKQVGKCWSRQWYRQYQPIPWIALNSRRGLLENWRVWFTNFGGGIEESIGKLIRLNGSDYVKLKKLVAWGSKKSKNLMMLYWLNKCGEWLIIMNLFVIEFLRLGFSQIAPF